jgi:hypothetical protein
LFLLGGLAIADGGFTLDCSFPFRCPGARNLVVRFRTAALASGSHIEFPGCCRCSAGDRASSHRGHEYPLAGVGQNRSRLNCYTPGSGLVCFSRLFLMRDILGQAVYL